MCIEINLKLNWSKEIFTIENLIKSYVVYYKINDIDNLTYL